MGNLTGLLCFQCYERIASWKRWWGRQFLRFLRERINEISKWLALLHGLHLRRPRRCPPLRDGHLRANLYACASVRGRQCTRVRVYVSASVRAWQCTCAPVYVCASVRACQCTCVPAYVCASVRVCQCTRVSLCASASVRVFQCTYMPVYVSAGVRVCPCT